jgi:uncharacterized membrane protein YqgA involved in biofilm formation
MNKRGEKYMEFEKEQIILLIICLIVGFIIGITINTDNVLKGSCNKEQTEINVLTKEINSCLDKLNQNIDVNAGIEK